MTNNPIISSPNKLKLGIFCTNGRGTAQHTLVPEANQQDWSLSLLTARAVDEAGYEAVVPFARWKGYLKDNPDHVSGYALDPFTWAAGIAQATRQVGIFVTSHAASMHPILAAKQTATIDHISNGRLTLNVVGGWNRPELEMFGAPLREHSQRYEHLAEWLGLVKRLWRSPDEFDHHGDFFDVVGGFSLPKPVQAGGPPIMNAGTSDRGRQFACEHADVCFIGLPSEDPKDVREGIASYKRIARETFGRDVQVWAHTFVVQRDTQQEADDYLEHYAVRHQDRRSVDALIEKTAQESNGLPREVLERVRDRFAAGAGGFPLVGTAEHIAAKLEMLSAAGLDGVLFTWVDYLDGIDRFNRQVLPLLEQAGLREPFPPLANRWDRHGAQAAVLPCG
ncbi:LLM class flavin-dependent oxidoreductase [Flavisphingomonas formosensis]|uniref:LLM class flavin-dependent oxidoreductase n=1 Tax=Flavisphingomonas formosensis TaxID=861534 RepID=UPI0012F7CCE9|nr:LLM class flavin-dependent oxidoreductase [Sphingomonas formosensis]